MKNPVLEFSWPGSSSPPTKERLAELDRLIKRGYVRDETLHSLFIDLTYYEVLGERSGDNRIAYPVSIDYSQPFEEMLEEADTTETYHKSFQQMYQPPEKKGVTNVVVRVARLGSRYTETGDVLRLMEDHGHVPARIEHLLALKRSHRDDLFRWGQNASEQDEPTQVNFLAIGSVQGNSRGAVPCMYTTHLEHAFRVKDLTPHQVTCYKARHPQSLTISFTRGMGERFADVRWGKHNSYGRNMKYLFFVIEKAPT